MRANADAYPHSERKPMDATGLTKHERLVIGIMSSCPAPIHATHEKLAGNADMMARLQVKWAILLADETVAQLG